ncbi:MAG: hypothetical protein ABIP48_21150 [Planctomycetota bacterium]
MIPTEDDRKVALLFGVSDHPLEVGSFFRGVPADRFVVVFADDLAPLAFGQLRDLGALLVGARFLLPATHANVDDGWGELAVVLSVAFHGIDPFVCGAFLSRRRRPTTGSYAGRGASFPWGLGIVGLWTLGRFSYRSGSFSEPGSGEGITRPV